MHRLEIDGPDIRYEFFCAIGPGHAIEHVNKVMKILGELKGLTQQPAAMVRWFLVAQAEDMVGVQRASTSHHHG